MIVFVFNDVHDKFPLKHFIRDNSSLVGAKDNFLIDVQNTFSRYLLQRDDETNQQLVEKTNKQTKERSRNFVGTLPGTKMEEFWQVLKCHWQQNFVECS